MAGGIIFVDNSINVLEALNDAVTRILEEAAGEVKSQTIRAFDEAHKNEILSNLDNQLKGSYDYRVDENEGKAVIGSPMEAAYWEEFGTGSHAEHGDGRKGWWVYVENGGTGTGGKSYPNEDEAVEAAMNLRSKGLDAYATNGKDPNRTLRTGFDKAKATVIRRAEEILREQMGDR